MNVARRPGLGTAGKVAISGRIVVASWIALLALILAIAGLTGPQPG
jgi:hypothetical protein